MPSAVIVDRDGQPLAGEKALRQAVLFPERAVRVPKRALVAASSVILGDAEVLVTGLVAAVLGRIYHEAVRFQGDQPPQAVVLTHPARWGDVPLERLRQAATEAGIEAPVLLPEPVAAAWWFGAPTAAGGPVDADGLVGVFDFGGGTLDTAVLRAVPGGFAIAGPPGGDPHLGGEDFDEMLFQHLSELAHDRDELAWADVFAGTGARARRELAILRDDVTAAKEALSEANAYDVLVPGFDDEFRVTRPELEELVGPALDGGVAEMGATITAAGVEPAALGGLYLTGGSSRMPLVAVRLATALGVMPQMRDDPKAAVVLGALTYLKAGAPTPEPLPDAPVPAAMAGDAAAALERVEKLLADQRAIDSRHARAYLGLEKIVALLVSQEDSAGARAVLESAINSGRPELLPYAAYQLGRLLNKSGTVPDGARAAYQRAIDSGHPEISPKAALEFGEILSERKDYTGARAALRSAASSGHPDYGPRAGYKLAKLHRKLQQLDEAKAAYASVAATSHELAAQAAAALGDILRDARDSAGAHAAYQQAATAERLASDSAWAGHFGQRLVHQGETALARAVFERVAEASDDNGFEAARALGNLLREEGDGAGANTAFARAVQLLRPRDPADATCLITTQTIYQFGLTLAREGYTDIAEAAFELGTKSSRGEDFPRYAAMARSALKHIATLQDDLSGPSGKITFSRKWSLTSLGSDLRVGIDQGSMNIAVTASNSETREVSAGPHLLRGKGTTRESGWMAVYVKPGKRLQVACSVGWSDVYFRLE